MKVNKLDILKKKSCDKRKEISILTDEVANTTFGISRLQHAKLKYAKKKDLRHLLTPLELIFMALGEEIMRKKIISNNANSFEEKYQAAQQAGNITNTALKRLQSSQNIKIVI